MRHRRVNCGFYKYVSQHNSIREAQNLTSPFSLANRVFLENMHPVPFWIDTICVPVDPQSRKGAIRSMEIIFKSATKVLVLDNALMRMHS